METSAHKNSAIAFLQLVVQGKIEEAYNQYIAEGFFHHNPFFKGDRASLKAGMEDNEAKSPGKILTICRALEDGDLVAVHSKVQSKKDGPSFSAVHLFRFENDKIIEAWDIVMPVPEDSINENGAF